MNAFDHFRLRDGQQVVVSFERIGVLGEALAPEIFLGQAMLLDHGAHCTVQNKDA